MSYNCKMAPADGVGCPKFCGQIECATAKSPYAKVLDQTYPSALMRMVMEERKHQDEKYGKVGSAEYPGPGGHDLTGWLIVIEKELHEAKDAATGGRREKTGRHTTRAELVQIAAVCFAALEQHGLDVTAPAKEVKYTDAELDGGPRDIGGFAA